MVLLFIIIALVVLYLICALVINMIRLFFYLLPVIIIVGLIFWGCSALT